MRVTKQNEHKSMTSPLDGTFFHVLNLYTDAPLRSNKKNWGETRLWIAPVNRVPVYICIN